MNLLLKIELYTKKKKCARCKCCTPLYVVVKTVSMHSIQSVQSVMTPSEYRNRTFSDLHTTFLVERFIYLVSVLFFPCVCWPLLRSWPLQHACSTAMQYMLDMKLKLEARIRLFCLPRPFFPECCLLHMAIKRIGKIKTTHNQKHRTRIDFESRWSNILFDVRMIKMWKEESKSEWESESKRIVDLKTVKTYNYWNTSLLLARIHLPNGGAKYVIHIVRHYKSHYLISSGVVVLLFILCVNFFFPPLSTLLSCWICVIWTRSLAKRAEYHRSGECQWSESL